MLRDFPRYPGVFKKSVRGKMCLFYRYLKHCPRENFLKMLPEGATLWVRKTPEIFKNKKFEKFLDSQLQTTRFFNLSRTLCCFIKKTYERKVSFGFTVTNYKVFQLIKNPLLLYQEDLWKEGFFWIHSYKLQGFSTYQEPFVALSRRLMKGRFLFINPKGK